MKKLVFIDYKDNIHGHRFVKLLSEFFEVDYCPISEYSDEELRKLQIRVNGSKIILIADYFRCSEKIEFQNCLKIIISWAFDIENYLKTNTETNVQIEVLIVDSNSSKNYWLMSGAKVNKILQFPFGVDQKLFTGNWIGANSNKVISLRNWDYTHNQKVLLEMLDQHSDEFKKFEFIFIGDGATLFELRNAYRHLEMSGLISFLGVIDNRELIKILPEYRLAISTSKSDGTSVSVLEAMSAGTPVLASDSSANKEIIKNTKNGFLFENDSAVNLYEILTLVLNSTFDLNAISANAKSFARKYADWDKNGRILLREMRNSLD